MSKWLVTLQVDASTSIVVEAATKEEAEVIAMQSADRPSLCHRCAEHIDIGDVVRAWDAEKEEQ